MESEEYEQTVKYELEHINESIHNWETAAHALERFTKKIEEIDTQYENQKILVVGHGFTINLYFAKLLGSLNNVYERFNTNNFADWGVYEEIWLSKEELESVDSLYAISDWFVSI